MKTHTLWLAMLLALASAAPLHAQAQINFDDVSSGTVVDTHYSGVTFSDTGPVASGGANEGVHAYAIADPEAPSQPNAVTVFPGPYGSGNSSQSLAGFNEQYGVIKASFSTPVQSVSITAVAELWQAESFGEVDNGPYLAAYDSGNNLVGSIQYYPQSVLNTLNADNVTGPPEVLTCPSSSANIKYVLFSSSYGSHYVVGVFDNLTYAAGPPPTFTQEPVNQTACAGISVSFTASASGVAPISYQWQVSTDQGTTWNNIGGATSTTLNVLAEVSLAGNEYRLLATNGGGTTPSTAATLMVNALPSVSVNAAVVCAGTPATLTATTSAANPSYAWMPGGATTPSITVSPGSTTTYTVTVLDGTTMCANSASATVTVNPPSPMNWTLARYMTSDTSDNLKAVTYGGGVFVTLGYDAATSYTSPTGVSWGQGGTGLGNSGAHLTGVACANGRYVAVGQYGDSFTSYDGLNWTGQNENNTGLSAVAGGPIAGGGFLFVAVGPQGRVQTAPYVAMGDLVWTAAYPVTGNPNFNGVAAVGGPAPGFVAVGDGGRVMVSSGVGAPPTWTLENSDPSYNLYGVTYGAGWYVAVGDAGKIISSADGHTWTAASYSASGSALRAVTYGNGWFVAVGDGGSTAVSNDGVHWTAYYSVTGDNLYGITYNNGNFVAVGDNGTIMDSIAPVMAVVRVPGQPGSVRLTVSGVANESIQIQSAYVITAPWFVWGTTSLDGSGNWQSGIFGAIGTQFFRAVAMPTCP